MSHKIWPYVDQAASQVRRDSVEPILEQYRLAILASHKFSTLTLGTVAPQFTGVAIMESEANEIVMELDMQWDGNPDIVLAIKTRVGVALPIQVKNIGFTAVCFSLREKRNLDFTLKVIGVDLSSIPGISDAIEGTIQDAIEDSITWPSVGTLEVKLIEANELTNKDIIGKSDPFAKLCIRPLPDRTKNIKTIDNQTSPILNDHFESQAAELVGCGLMPLRNLEAGKVKDLWLKLVKDLDIQRDNKNRGQVHLELLYCPFSTENVWNPFDPDFRLTSLEKALKHLTEDGADSSREAAAAKKKDIIVRGVLSVTVVSAESLPATDLMGK
ncbi:synaptotagmin-5-like [Salvia divinorum]|uniref:Synaptotagmin-5-like n=1 Tax=Salvia divinorum TaxID=28513 RepID=A0ABD1FPI3_SALDI